MQIYMAGPLFTPYERAFIDQGAVLFRSQGFDCFVPHEQGFDEMTVTADEVFRKDLAGLDAASAVVALLDGCMVDDGTACEVGLFYGLMQHDRSRKGIIGVVTDTRAQRPRHNLEGKGVNLYVLGLIEAVGELVSSYEQCLPILTRWSL